MHADHRILAYIDNELVAHCALVSRGISINDLHYRAYLLGWMCTRKEIRRSGIGSQLLAYITDPLRNYRKHLLVLNCGKIVVPFYTENGFHMIAEKAEYDRSGRTEIDEDPVLVLILDSMVSIEKLFTEKVHLGADF